MFRRNDPVEDSTRGCSERMQVTWCRRWGAVRAARGEELVVGDVVICHVEGIAATVTTAGVESSWLGCGRRCRMDVLWESRCKQDRFDTGTVMVPTMPSMVGVGWRGRMKCVVQR